MAPGDRSTIQWTITLHTQRAGDVLIACAQRVKIKLAAKIITAISPCITFTRIYVRKDLIVDENWSAMCRLPVRAFVLVHLGVSFVHEVCKNCGCLKFIFIAFIAFGSIRLFLILLYFHRASLPVWRIRIFFVDLRSQAFTCWTVYSIYVSDGFPTYLNTLHCYPHYMGTFTYEVKYFSLTRTYVNRMA